MGVGVTPMQGYTYVYSVPGKPLAVGDRNAVCIIAATTSNDVMSGQTVIVDMVNEEVRHIRPSGVQLYIVPNEAILMVLE